MRMAELQVRMAELHGRTAGARGRSSQHPPPPPAYVSGLPCFPWSMRLCLHKTLKPKPCMSCT